MVTVAGRDVRVHLALILSARERTCIIGYQPTYWVAT
jgi:hypothetical protein